MPVLKYENVLFDICADAAITQFTKYYITDERQDRDEAVFFEVCRDAILFQSPLKDDIILIASEVLWEAE